jgi:hypothetical protein
MIDLTRLPYNKKALFEFESSPYRSTQTMIHGDDGMGKEAVYGCR